MTDVQEYCLRWNNHQSNLVSSFHDLRLGEDFVDVTLACEGQSLQAHKVVLSACSPFFRDILKTTPCKHPVIVLRDILFSDLVALIEFMYLGEIRVKHHGLPSFLRAAEVLRVRGLAESSTKLNGKPSSDSPAEHSLLSRNSSLNPSSSSSEPGQKNEPTDIPQLELPLHSPTFPSTVDNSAADSIGLLAEVKVEEVDIDSASEDDDEIDELKKKKMFTPRGIDAHAINRESNSTLQSEEDGLSQPSLTLQSFARIPSVVSPESNVLLNPDNSQDHIRNAHEERMPNHDVPGIKMIDLTSAPKHCCLPLQGNIDCENSLARAPGRMSSSDRPRWPCPFCMRLLSSRSSVRRHIEDRHTNDTSRHPCPLCERLYRTRNSLQYHLSTAHRDREPGPRGRPRIRPRTPPIADNNIAENKNIGESEVGMQQLNMPINMLFNLNRSPTFGLPPN